MCWSELRDDLSWSPFRFYLLGRHVEWSLIGPSSYWANCAEFVFVNLLRTPGIDSPAASGPVRQPYFVLSAARLHRLAESIPRNWFLGSVNVYKYGLSVEKLGMTAYKAWPRPACNWLIRSIQFNNHKYSQFVPHHHVYYSVQHLE